MAGERLLIGLEGPGGICHYLKQRKAFFYRRPPWSDKTRIRLMIEAGAVFYLPGKRNQLTVCAFPTVLKACIILTAAAHKGRL